MLLTWNRNLFWFFFIKFFASFFVEFAFPHGSLVEKDHRARHQGVFYPNGIFWWKFATVPKFFLLSELHSKCVVRLVLTAKSVVDGEYKILFVGIHKDKTVLAVFFFAASFNLARESFVQRTKTVTVEREHAHCLSCKSQKFVFVRQEVQTLGRWQGILCRNRILSQTLHLFVCETEEADNIAQ